MINEGELHLILNTIENLTLETFPDPESLREMGFKIQGWMAYSAECMVEAKEALHYNRKQAAINLFGNLPEIGKKMPAMAIRDFINDSCGKYLALYELCERTNKTCTHALGFIVSNLSYLKVEMQTLKTI